MDIACDAIGNPIHDGVWTYTWENGRQLRRMACDATIAEFMYNADGLRVQKTVNGVTTNYTLHGKNIVHLTKGNAELHFWYDAQNRPAIVEFNGTKYGYLYNLQGDVIGLIDSANTEVVRYTYDAWGKPLSVTGSLANTIGYYNPFRYRGYVYDVETGLYYLRSRYYNPRWGRFVNADNLVKDNLFAYCKNAPIAFADTNGRDIEDCIHVYFKDTFVISGADYDGYKEWLGERHPNEMPQPALIESTGNVINEFISSQVVASLGKLGDNGESFYNYGTGILGPFFSFNHRTEAYIYRKMLECNNYEGYKSVKIELLHGSHSAEVRLTLYTQQGNTYTFDPIITQGYKVVLDMIVCLSEIVKEHGGKHWHEEVEWKYSLMD